MLDRTIGNCLICHKAPEPAERFMGEIGPDLAGVGARLTAGQIRLRLVDQSRLNPKTVMPPYYRVEGWLGSPSAIAASRCSTRSRLKMCWRILCP